MGFSDSLVPLKINSAMSLEDAVGVVNRVSVEQRYITVWDCPKSCASLLLHNFSELTVT